MKTLVAVCMGFFSGFMIYMMAGMMMVSMVLTNPTTYDSLSVGFVLLTFFGGWIASTWLLLRGAISTSKVFSRGFLLGAAEWLLMIAVGAIFAGKIVSGVSSGSDAASAGAAVGGGLVAFLTGGISIAMAVVCLIGFAISHSLGKEMRAEVPSPTPTKKCPACAELVQAEATKCRYCGEALTKA